MARFSRREFLQSSIVAVAATVSSSSRAASPLSAAGAIRWDAWYARKDNSILAQENLGPNKFHARAPKHCEELSLSDVSCVGSQVIMDNEILAAAKGGLNFWAFVWFASDTSFRTAWDLYQASKYKSCVNWCGIATLEHFGSSSSGKLGWREKCQEWAAYMAQKNYQRVEVSGVKERPLLFLLWYPSDIQNYFGGNLANVRSALSYLRELVTGRGLGAPYIVIMNGVNGAPLVSEVGADAISNYIPSFVPGHLSSYVDLDKQAQKYWRQLSKTGAQTVPIAIVGWDTRPRQDASSHWRPQNFDPDRYYSIATPEQFSSHLRSAVSYIDNNLDSCPSRVLLIYSWNECDEGGALMPTLGDPEGNLLAATAAVMSSRTCN
ncbi:glycoside hydrolase family 99-like domain-containing protein [Bradyrhizobium sp. WSM471]|uniref:glycoside hydrolase family 99-like domain-containing protein n=1 Tax=Bradyrhizobium sp. WSM471 TaxID=319017 RepID=UPI00024D21BC|nr:MULTISPECIES: glycoside hydrolase family 99-like domain-containing protein [Bradyrhizobium]EHR01331.1 hypothetical protein Bra471DRAFT_02038 [Bradyrhizobium sp. WSM471]UFW43391.1 glycoside hydrolase family 99-like domain-containing protein [Bradyrhizobium canariense]